MNVDQQNPEVLLEDGTSASMILYGEEPPSSDLVRAARNLAQLLISCSPIVLARTISYFAEHGGSPPNVSAAMVDLLERKIYNSTPDELNTIVMQARQNGVWQQIKPSILARNADLAKLLDEYTNASAIDIFLDQVATADKSWIPGPVFETTVNKLRQMAKTASLDTLDIIVDIANKWRMRNKVLPSVIKRNKELVESIADYGIPSGYPMRKGSRQILVASPMKALRMQADGYTFIRSKE